MTRKKTNKNYKLLVETAALAGEIMLTSGAETYRVEDTVSRILKTSGLDTAETYVTATGFILTLDGAEIDAITVVRRVTVRDTNLNRIYLVNQISRMLCEDGLPVQEGMVRLKQIRKERQYSSWIISVCTVATTVFFPILYGANAPECVCAALNGLILVFFLKIGKKLELSKLIINILTAIFMAFLAAVFEQLIGSYTKVDKEMILVGSIMPLVPGVAITNAIRDTLHGDYLSGGARAIEAFVLAATIAAGVGAGLFIYNGFF